MSVLLGRELHAEPLGLPDAEAGVTGPHLELRALVGPQAERVHVERARAVGVRRRDAYEVELADHGCNHPTPCERCKSRNAARASPDGTGSRPARAPTTWWRPPARS